MPNRVIKESICMSEDIAQLSESAEILFYRLMVKADDFGAYYGNPAIIKNTCYPLKADDINCNQVISWLNELISVGLVIYYEAADGKCYVQIAKWEKHQQIRAKKPKFPVFDSNCNQMISVDSKCSRNPIQSNTESNPNPIHSVGGRASRFHPPTVEDVREYCMERGNRVDPQRFVDYYTANGWKVGKNPMKDWKAAVRTWERSENGKPAGDSGNIFFDILAEGVGT